MIELPDKYDYYRQAIVAHGLCISIPEEVHQWRFINFRLPLSTFNQIDKERISRLAEQARLDLILALYSTPGKRTSTHKRQIAPVPKTDDDDNWVSTSKSSGDSTPERQRVVRKANFRDLGYRRVVISLSDPLLPLLLVDRLVGETYHLMCTRTGLPTRTSAYWLTFGLLKHYRLQLFGIVGSLAN